MNKLPLAAYRKAVVAAMAALAILAVALADGKVTGQEWVNVAIAALTALGVRQVPNEPTP